MTPGGRNTGPIEHDDEPDLARSIQERDSLTRWVVGVVLAALLGIAFAAAQFVFQQTMDNTRRITTLERAMDAMNSANAEQHKAMLDGIGRIERVLDTKAK